MGLSTFSSLSQKSDSEKAKHARIRITRSICQEFWQINGAENGITCLSTISGADILTRMSESRFELLKHSAGASRRAAPEVLKRKVPVVGWVIGGYLQMSRLKPKWRDVW